MIYLEQGATLFEATILISVLATMTAVLAPVGGAMIDRARVITAKQQVSALASAMDLLLADQYGRLPLADARLLVSDGDVPRASDDAWSAPVDGRQVLLLTDVLYENTFSLPEPSSAAAFGWRGPYMQEEIGPDPWGNRFSVSVADGGPTVILSAGPDATTETPFARLAAGPLDGDDIRFVIGS